MSGQRQVKLEPYLWHKQTKAKLVLTKLVLKCNQLNQISFCVCSRSFEDCVQSQRLKL